MESMETKADNPEITRYLRSGQQTMITPRIKEISSFLTGSFNEKISNIFQYIKTLRRDESNKGKIFRKRTTDQIIEDGFITGCTDEGLVFITLARAAGIPAKYIETIKTKSLEDTENNDGHVFVGVYDKDKGWEIVEPQWQTIGADPAKEGFTVVAEGLDSWDLGITDVSSLKGKFDEFRKLLKNSDNQSI